MAEGVIMAQTNATETHFWSCLLKIEKQLTKEDIKNLKFRLNGCLSSAELGKESDGKDIFEALYRNAFLSMTDVNYLAKILTDIGRPTLVKHLEQCGYRNNYTYQSHIIGKLLNQPDPPLIGRDKELNTIKTNLLGDTKIFHLYGPSGHGKTSLILKVAEILKLDDFNAKYFEIRKEDSVEGFATAVLQSLASHQGQDPVNEMKNLLCGYDLSQRLLIIIDNIDNLPEADTLVDLIIDVAEYAPNVRMLITSKEKEPYFERSKVVVPSHGLTELDLATSKRLIGMICGIIGKQSSSEDIERIAEASFCIPLVIKLGLPLLECMPLKDLIFKLKNSETSGQKKLNTCLQLQFDVLDKNLKAFVTSLLVFPASFNSDEVQQIVSCDVDCEKHLERLTRAVLIQFDKDNEVYRVHPYVKHELTRLMDADSVSVLENMKKKFSEFYLKRLLKYAFEDFFSKNSKSSVPNFLANKVNILHALKLAMADQNGQEQCIDVTLKAMHFLARVLPKEDFIEQFDLMKELCEKRKLTKWYCDCQMAVAYKLLLDAEHTISVPNAVERLEDAYQKRIPHSRETEETLAYYKIKRGLCYVMDGCKEGLDMLKEGVELRRKVVNDKRYKETEDTTDKVKSFILLGSAYKDLAGAYGVLATLPSKSEDDKKATRETEISTRNIAFEIYDKHVGEQHPFHISPSISQSVAHRELEQTDEAVKYAKKALHIHNEFLQFSHDPELGKCHFELAVSLEIREDIELAIKEFTKSYLLYKQLLGENDSKTMEAKQKMEKLMKLDSKTNTEL